MKSSELEVARNTASGPEKTTSPATDWICYDRHPELPMTELWIGDYKLNPVAEHVAVLWYRPGDPAHMLEYGDIVHSIGSRAGGDRIGTVRGAGQATESLRELWVSIPEGASTWRNVPDDWDSTKQPDYWY